MGRKLRSTLPFAAEKLTPKLPNYDQLWKTEQAYKHQQAENYNRRHRASPLPNLNPGNKVWIPDKTSTAVVVQKSAEPRSYVVKTEQSLLRRNRHIFSQTPRRRLRKLRRLHRVETPAPTKARRPQEKSALP